MDRQWAAILKFDTRRVDPGAEARHNRRMIRVIRFPLVFVVLLVSFARAEITEQAEYSFSVKHTVTISASRETVWEAFTGDISGWWDHSFSGKPAKFFIEPKPGGGFIELFDDQGNGVKHGTVIYAQKPSKLNFEGPLPFNGLAMNMVHQVFFKATADGARTELTVVCNAFGKLDPSWAEAVDGVWHHFLVERLKPFVEGTL